jgi:hypothetical protein
MAESKLSPRLGQNLVSRWTPLTGLERVGDGHGGTFLIHFCCYYRKNEKLWIKVYRIEKERDKYEKELGDLKTSNK